MFVAKNEEMVMVSKTHVFMHPIRVFGMGDVRETTPNMSFGPKLVDWACSLRKTEIPMTLIENDESGIQPSSSSQTIVGNAGTLKVWGSGINATDTPCYPTNIIFCQQEQQGTLRK